MRRTWAGLPLLWMVLAAPAPADEPTAADLEFFEKSVRPVLHARCVECHGPKVQKGGLRLDTRAGALAGGESGPAVEPGKPDESLLVAAIGHDDAPRMPPKSKLPAAEIAALTAWVARGAPWPAEAAASGAAVAKPEFNLDERARHWSFQPVRPGPVPPVRDASWPRTPIDHFLLAAIEAKALRPAPDADRRAWLRRVTFDLTGLPPTLADVNAFLNNTNADAPERVVDRLLASPHYGERQARHWLDLVRWAETFGHEFDYDIADAWRYRDYAVRAFNADLPYDRFLVEAIAGDLLPEPRRDPATGRNESALGTAFWTLGEGTHSPVDLPDEQVRRIENQIDVFGKAVLGLTVACARCHDHKFDPIRQADYYALSGYLKSSRLVRTILDPPATFDGPRAELDRLREAISGRIPEHDFAPSSPPSSPAFATFDAGLDGWTAYGPAFRDRPTRAGEPRLVLDSAPPRLERWPAGWMHSGLASRRLVGVLRSPTFTIDADAIHLRLAGRNGHVRLVVDGFDKIRSPIYGGLTREVQNEAPHWVTLDVAMWRGHRAYLEIADGAIVDYTGGRTAAPPGDGWIALDEVVRADGPAPRDARPEPVAVAILAGDPAIADAIARARAIEAAIPTPTFAPGLADGTPEDDAIHVRGNPRNLGAPAPRRFLEVIAGAAGSPDPAGSGRLALAQGVTDPANPLVARVIVNRVWAQHFGVGLVPTPDDLGAMGRPPSHPELLDWLADWFVREGWSLKKLHRLIVTSRAYGMDSVPADPAAEAADPENVLLHRMPLRRQEAEALRDAMLAVSGRLDPRLGGPSVPPHLTPFMDGRGRPDRSGPLDGDGRRTLYTNLRRNFVPPFLLAFDYPVPATTIGRRGVSNVPAQALALQNDPLVVELAGAFAVRAANEAGDPDARVAWMFETALGRPPTGAERAAVAAFFASRPRPPALDDWSELAHTLFNAKEFLHVR
jgi:mono/diheme cytochrome c family protein